MSFHRVLPSLPGLTNQALQDPWAIPPKNLVASNIMPDNIGIELATSNDIGPIKSVSNDSPPSYGGGSSSVSRGEVEDSRYPDRSPSQIPDADGHPSGTVGLSPDETLDPWQGESPSSICLCQPDPKVPRPRNGSYIPVPIGADTTSTRYE